MFRTLFVGLVFSLIVLAPLDASAAIIPCGEANNPCTACDAFGLISNALSYLVGLITLVIVLVIVWAGIQIVTSKGDPGSISKAKGMLWNAIVGFAILLVAWLGVDTVIKVLTNNEATFGRPWNQIDVNQCNPPAYTVPVTPTGSSTPGGTGTTTPGTGSSASHDAALATLRAAGVTVHSSGVVQGDCTTLPQYQGRPACGVSINGCTSLNNIQSGTINEVVAFSGALRSSPNCANCQVVVTGGTEPGHACGPNSHSTGAKIDIDDSSAVNAFIQGRDGSGANGFSRQGSRNGDPRYCKGGAEYVKEDTHWDITVGAGCPAGS